MNITMTVKCSDHRKTKHDIMYKFVTENYHKQNLIMMALLSSTTGNQNNYLLERMSLFKKRQKENTGSYSVSH